jgi:hypothetical protein
MPNKETSNGERVRRFITGQGHAAGGVKVNTSTHLWGTDGNFRFK